MNIDDAWAQYWCAEGPTQGCVGYDLHRDEPAFSHQEMHELMRDAFVAGFAAACAAENSASTDQA